MAVVQDVTEHIAGLIEIVSVLGLPVMVVREPEVLLQRFDAAAPLSWTERRARIVRAHRTRARARRRSRLGLDEVVWPSRVAESCGRVVWPKKVSPLVRQNSACSTAQAVCRSADEAASRPAHGPLVARILATLATRGSQPGAIPSAHAGMRIALAPRSIA